MHALENIAALKEALRILKEELGERNSPDPLPKGCHLGNIRMAPDHYEQQLIIVREIGDRRGEGNALFYSAMACKTLGNLQEAVARATAALAIREAIEDPNAAKVRAQLAEWQA